MADLHHGPFFALYVDHEHGTSHWTDNGQWSNVRNGAPPALYIRAATAETARKTCKFAVPGKTRDDIVVRQIALVPYRAPAPFTIYTSPLPRWWRAIKDALDGLSR